MTSRVFAKVVLALVIPVSHAGTPVATTTTLASSLNPSAYGQAVTFTATVSSPSGTPGGKVTFENGAKALGTATLSGHLATFTTATLGVGTAPITAVYKGSAKFSTSSSAALGQAVTKAASTTTLVSSLNPSTFGQSVTFTATVSSLPVAPTGPVNFKNGTKTLASVTMVGGVASFTPAALAAGTESIVAAYAGTGRLSASSAAITQTVYAGGFINYTLNATPLSQTFLTAGNASTSTVTVTPVNGYAGTVSLLCSINGGGAPAPSCSFNPSSVAISGGSSAAATLTVSTSAGAPAGSYSISVTGSDASNLPPANGPQVLGLSILPAGTIGYALTASPLMPAFVAAGSSSTSTVTVIPVNGYTGSVGLSCGSIGGNSPPPSCAFSPSSVTLSGANSGAATLTVSTSTGTPAGSYSIPVTGSDTNSLGPANGAQALALTTAGVIQHVVIIFQENRTPDNLFQGLPGADIASTGVNSAGEVIQLQQTSMVQSWDLAHLHDQFVLMYDNGLMDGADKIWVGCTGAPGGCPPNPQFQYVDPAQVAPYFQLAETYTFGDRMFQTNQGPSYTAHQFIIAGTSVPSVGGAYGNYFVADTPIPEGPTGCVDAPSTQSVPLIDPSGNESVSIYPCFEHPTINDLLDAAGVSWRYYSPGLTGIWVGPNSIEHLRTGPDWNNVISPQSQVLTDIADGNLAQVAWVIPNGPESDHASVTDGSGPAWVASIVNAIGASPYWNNTAIIITWDDWGGWYDHVAPKIINSYEYGFRVPLIVVSPYANQGYVSHVTHDFGSILHFMESTFNLPSLGYADALADDLSDCFNLSQAARAFRRIPSEHGADYFIERGRTVPVIDPDDD